MNKSTQKTVFSNKTDNWSTPKAFFDKLNKIYGPFDLDPCADAQNATCEKYFTEQDDGLKQDWSGHCVYVNPPYSKTKDWIKKAYTESLKENTKVVMLIASRTDTKYFHEYVFKHASQILFVKGRLKFGGSKNSAPFPSAVVIFDNKHYHNLANKQQITTIDRA